MPDLRAQLNTALKGRVCLVGIGNVELGDDGFGVRLAETLAPVGQTPGLPVPGAFGSEDPILTHPVRLAFSNTRNLSDRSADTLVRLAEWINPEADKMSALQKKLSAPHPSARGTGLPSNPEPADWKSAPREPLPVSEPTPLWISVVMAGTSPEIWVNRLGLFDHVIFLDAVHFSGAPGSMVWLNASEIWARFPQVSTHKLSLSLLAGMVESSHHTRAWLLGVQPLSLKPGAALSEPVQTTLVLLRDLLASLIVPQSRKALDVWQARMPAVEMENLKP